MCHSPWCDAVIPKAPTLARALRGKAITTNSLCERVLLRMEKPEGNGRLGNCTESSPPSLLLPSSAMPSSAGRQLNMPTVTLLSFSTSPQPSPRLHSAVSSACNFLLPCLCLLTFQIPNNDIAIKRYSRYGFLLYSLTDRLYPAPPAAKLEQSTRGFIIA